MTDNGHSVFMEIATEALGEKVAEGLDRYCLRHTAVTWMRLCYPEKKIIDMVAHMSSRMIDQQYGRKPVKDQRDWWEAMPLHLDEISHDWQGYLLECVMLAKWPQLARGEKPKDDPMFPELLKIISATKIERPKMSLFD